MTIPYTWIKSLHVVAIISWMAGILYYYRLFIYHFEYGQKNEEIHSLLSLMEKRLFKYITVPAMVIAVLTGLSMIHLNRSLLSQPWFLVKFGTAILLVGATSHGTGLLRRFRNRDFERYSSRKLRILNEVPTLLMIIIVIMVIVRPF